MSVQNCQGFSVQFKPGVGQNMISMALHVAPTVRNSEFLTAALPVHSSSFLAILIQYKVKCAMNKE